MAAAPVYAGIAARDPALEAQAERIAIAVGQALDKRGVVDLGSPPLPDAVDGPDAILDNLVAAAEKLVLDGDFNAALAKADEAIARFERDGGSAFREGTAAWTSYGKALVARALALRRLGKEGESDASLAKLAVVMPKAVPDPGLTPPKVAQKHQQILEDLRGKPRVEIEVQSDPPGADVVVDGVAAGKTPLVVRDLYPGTHFVAISAEDARAEKRVNVTAATGTARISERVGDPRAAAIRVLRTNVAQASGADALLDAARDVGDDVVIGAIMPDEAGPLVVLGRARDGKLAVVAGARFDKKVQAGARATALAEALLDGKGGWLDEGGAETAPDVDVEQALVRGLGGGVANGAGGISDPDPDPDRAPGGGGDDGGDGTPWVLFGVGAGVAALVVTGAVVGVLVAAANANKVEVVIDASNLN